MDDRRNKVIVGAVLAVAVIGVIVLVAVWKSSPNCKLVENKPEALKAEDLTKLANIKSGDGLALANFAGYLQYELADKASKKIYMPLSQQSVTLASTTDTTKLLTIGSDCAKIAISLTNTIPAKDITKQAIDSIQVDLTLKNGDQESCKIEGSVFAPVEDTAKSHYGCKQEKSVVCSATVKDDQGKETKKTVATLVLQDLEFEVSKEKYADDKFKTPSAGKC